ncbi:Protein EARLY FLOWERING [Stylosanthes scabra]|uniref:Protein EARLY FLOWERING n=1 Tax=Stylosanthes scabra TaxID=79078 RepID=A0ABU6WDT7_9FABA|nr:Protein EARLY FLOWERING [Stylosanthes scabra]
MKRGKEEDKVVGGAMFPRLHVNDTEKGGPRAPPRNKMALYEQFSVPSQRFNTQRLLPINHPTTPSSSSQGTGPERSYAFPDHTPSQASTRRESYSSRQYDGANLNTSSAQVEQRRRVDDDDFMVPVYVHSRNGQSNDETVQSSDARHLTPMVRSERHTPLISNGQQPVMSFRNISSKETVDGLRQANTIPNQDVCVSNISRSHDADACLRPVCVAGSQTNDDEHGDIMTENQTSPQEDNNDPGCQDTQNGGPMQGGNLDDSDDISKISSVENSSILRVSTDDVVGILGHKHFFKARREIANQQRIFAVQVFELHRLIKVQQLIAGSPELLIEDAAFIGKIPLKGSTTKTVSLEEVVEPKRQNLKRKDDSQKLNHKMECSAENAVGKAPFSSQKSGSHHLSYSSTPGDPHQANGDADNRMAPMSFNPSPGHQWLIPVMTPSEGLVYKPYPGPGFTGSFCGGFGPFGPVPMSNPYLNPVYGLPASQEAIGVPPYVPPGSHAYFPPYGMPFMNNQAMSGSAVEQGNQFMTQGSHLQNGHSSVDRIDFNAHNQGSSNQPVQKTRSASLAGKSRSSKDIEYQGSSTNSPNETAQQTRTTPQVAEGRDANSPFLVDPVVASDGTNPPHETRQETRVIKVVPHNRRSATESAARIFLSIQEERKRYDS